jgi:predicted oxidoreductase
MAERYRVDGMHFARAGLRWTPVKGWSLDGSRAQAISGTSGPRGPIWTLGVTREFD